MPCLVSSRSLTESSAFFAWPLSTPMPAITQKPCGSMKIWPSSLSLLPTFLPKKS